MGFFKDSASILGVCVGIIIVLFVIIMAGSFITDYDPSTTIENNKTIEVNGVRITVPETSNYTINENASLWNVNDTKKFGIENEAKIVEGNAYQYYDGVNNISIYVADANRTAYSDVPDFSELTTLDGDIDRTHIEKKSVGDKVVVMYVTEGKGLSKLIIDSATIAED